jgi:Sugar (and other) transporter
MELLTPEWGQIVATLSSFFYVLFFAFITAYVQFISNDYRLITYVGAAFGSIAFLGVWLFLDESALYLLKKGKIKKAEAVIRSIFRSNSRETSSLETPLISKVDEAL